MVSGWVSHFPHSLEDLRTPPFPTPMSHVVKWSRV
jgi:hypothetical protein